MRLGACAIAVAVVLRQIPAAAGDPAIAREQLKIGYALAQEGKCSEALPHLVESLRLDPKAITLINLADCEEKVGQLTVAMGHWVDARARAQVEGQRPIEEEATARATALEPRLARLTIALAPASPKDAVVERDGVMLGQPSLGIPLPLDPGSHAIVVRAKGHVDATTHVSLAEGESKGVEVRAGDAVVTPRPVVESSPGRTSPLVFAGFGVAAAGVAVGTVTGLMAFGAGNEAETTCPAGACRDQRALDDVERGRSLGTVSTIAFIAAGAGAAVGIYGLVWGAKKTDPSVAVSFVPSGAFVRGRF